MPTLRGAGIIFGTGITSTGAVVIASTSGLVQGEEFTREADIAEVRDSDGDVAIRAYHNARKTLRITVVPCDTATPTVADARTNADAMLPAPGTVATIADANSTIVDGTHSAAYLVDRASRRTTNTGEAVIDVELYQNDANDVSATVS